MKKYLIAFIILTITACGDFLEESSQDLVYASSCEDLNEILIGNAYMNNNISEYSFRYASGGSYYPWLWIMDDDCEQFTKSGSEFTGQQLDGFYRWKASPFIQSNGSPIDDYEWERLYKHIAATNVVIDQVKEFPNDPEELRNKVKGEALFLRAAYYYLLVNMYSAPYEEEKANSTLGVPLKQTSYIEDLKFHRTHQDTVYQSIIDDLTESAKCLTNINTKELFKANSYSAWALLSRVYLYMEKWESVLQACEEVEKGAFKLEKLTPEYSQNFLRQSNPEIIFAQGSQCMANIFGTLGGYMYKVSDNLLNSYTQEGGYKDLRIDVFFTSQSSRLAPGKIKSLINTFREPGDIPDAFVIRYAEVLLNKAEALAMLHREDEAIEVLNHLLANRFEDGIFPAISVKGNELIDFIRAERRRELCFEGHRWFDLRRYAVNTQYPLKNYEITHNIYAEKPESGVSAQIGYCILKGYPEGKGWILPIPAFEININPAIGDNEREDATYVEL